MSHTSLYISADSGTGISREDFIAKIATDVLSKLPEEFDMDKIRKVLGLDIGPTTVVLLQELDRFNLLINRMARSLATLKRVRALLFIRIIVKFWYP